MWLSREGCHKGYQTVCEAILLDIHLFNMILANVQLKVGVAPFCQIVFGDWCRGGFIGASLSFNIVRIIPPLRSWR